MPFDVRAYLKHVLELQQREAELSKRVAQMQHCINSLGHQRQIQAPTFVRKSFFRDLFQWLKLVCAVIISVIVCYFFLRLLLLIIVGIIIWLIELISKDPSGLSGRTNLILDAVCLWIPRVVVVLIGMLTLWAQREQYKEKFVVPWQQYDQAVAQDQQRVTDELARKVELEAQLPDLQAQWTEVQDQLAALYNQRNEQGNLLLRENCRNAEAVTELLKHLDSGCIHQLEGQDGAYKKYDDAAPLREVRKKLEAVTADLANLRQETHDFSTWAIEAINANKAGLAQLADDVQRQLNSLSRSVDAARSAARKAAREATDAQQRADYAAAR